MNFYLATCIFILIFVLNESNGANETETEATVTSSTETNTAESTTDSSFSTSTTSGNGTSGDGTTSEDGTSNGNGTASGGNGTCSDGKSINGTTAKLSVIAGIIFNGTNSTKFCCGGIAAPGYVLTSCRCLGRRVNDKYEPNKVDIYDVVAGTQNMKDKNRDGQWRRVSKIHAHPHCLIEPIRMVYDVGVIKLDAPFSIGKNVKLMKFPNLPKYVTGRFLYYMIKKNYSCTATSYKKGTVNEILLTLTPIEKCDAMCEGNSSCKNEASGVNHFCAIPGNKSDLCKAAPGSPLLCNNIAWGLSVNGPDCEVKTSTEFARFDKNFFHWYNAICGSQRNIAFSIFLLLFVTLLIK